MSGDQISLLSFRAEGKAMGASSRLGRTVQLVEIGDVASQLVVWRTGFRYTKTDVVGYGTGRFEEGPLYFGACISLLTVNSHFISSPDDSQPLMVAYSNLAPRDTEAFILLDEHGGSSEKPVRVGDTVILRRANGRYLHCRPGLSPAFRSTSCTEEEKFRIWF
jgi:hypothetical protein